MLFKKFLICFLIFACCLSVNIVTFGASTEASKIEKQAYRQELYRIKSLRQSFTSGPTNDLKEYERFADQIHSKWNKGNRECYARLMLEVCGPITSGYFKGNRRYQLARKYALSALEKPDEIPLEVELELTGRVITLMCTPYAPKGEDFAQRRKKDVEIRLHAWKRLIEAIDPNWDPNDLPLKNIPPPVATGFPSGVAPEAIKDPNLRAEYEAAIERNRQTIERRHEQRMVHDWLKRFPRYAEPYIIRAYSRLPYNMEELKQYLDNYIADEKTKARILNTVTKNIGQN